MIQIEKRNICVCILLSIVTFGVYGIYWMYLLVKNTRSIQKIKTSCVGEMLCLFLVPFYYLYWWYTKGEKTKQEFNEHNYTAGSNGTVYLVLALFGFSIVSMAIMQSDFNSLETVLTLEKQHISIQAEENHHHSKLLLSIRIALLVISIALIIAGILNGGMADVLSKAVNICTECIGLG